MRSDHLMWDRLFRRRPGRSLQGQIREMLVAVILDGRLAPDSPVPSSRELAQSLGVARNTVVLVYDQLVDEGFLIARERSGHYVNPEVTAGRAETRAAGRTASAGPDWPARFAVRASAQRNIAKPQDWQDQPYPFLYGQFDASLFPIAEWRECCRQALSVLEIRGWGPDRIDGDDALLVEQLRTRLLPRRGIWARADEIMVTIGAQQALFLLAELLVRPDTRVGIEDPGYPDARNIFAIRGCAMTALAVDRDGLVPGPALAGCDYVYVTPSHQCPTTVTMTLARREQLLRLAGQRDIVLIEDDYEAEISFTDHPTPALKSLDDGGRVIYVGSLSKTLAPGLRLGFVVAPAELVREARALRRLMLRHPPANNQRAAALFLSLGHYDALLMRLTQVLRQRSQMLVQALQDHLPDCRAASGAGGSSLWVAAPDGVDARLLAEAAQARGILIEPGDVFFAGTGPPRQFFRLGFSSIDAERIAPGIAELGRVMRQLA